MKRSPEFIKRKIGTRYVIVAMGKAAKRFDGMISVNGTGAAIWDLLEQDTTEAEIAAALAARFEVDLVTAEADVRGFVETLKGVGAVVE